MKGIPGSTKIRQDLRDNIKEIISLYNSKITAEKIGIKFNASKGTILKLLKLNGIKRRKAAPFKGRIPWNKGKPSPKLYGPNNPRWKGGITSLNQKIRHCFSYKQWIREVFLKDDYTCKICFKRGGNIEADHHPKPFYKILEDNNIKSFEEALKCQELWNILNGRTVCMKCHKRGNIKPIRSRFKKVSNKK